MHAGSRPAANSVFCWQIKIQDRAIAQDVPRKRDVTAAGHYAAITCEAARLHFHGSSSSIFVLG